MDKINQANLTPVLDVASRFTTLKKIGREWYGPCPVCRAGRDRFYVIEKKNVCGCRRCEKRWDSSGLYAAVYGLKNYDAALEMLGETKPQSPRRAEVQKVQKLEVSNDNWKTKEWQSKASDVVQACSSTSGEVFDDYVKARALSERTIDAFCIGFQPHKFDPAYGKTRPAMVIPWMGDSEFYSVKYRFINERPGLRYISLADGNPLVFGEHLLSRHNVLIVVEGEINAMSIWQVFRGRADVLSVGGDSNDPSKEYVRQLAENRGYDLVIAWFDDIEKAARLKHEFEGIAVRPIHSVNGQDANDVLVKHGEAFLFAVLEEAEKNPNRCPYCTDGMRIMGKGKMLPCICGGSK